MIIVTTNEIPGYRIDAVLGEVMGMTVRSANLGANFVASFRAMGGGEIHEFTKIVYESRNEVMNRMWADAQQRGANAIVGMRFDTGDIAQAFTEVCAYGTAVVVRPIPDGEDGATVQSAQQAAQSGSRAAAPQEARPERRPPSDSGHPAPGPAPRPAAQPSAQPPQPAPGPQPVPGEYGYSPQVPPPTGPGPTGRPDPPDRPEQSPWQQPPSTP
jgi:uncharacterized protein YbjQ (UPF0145 family)